MSNLEIFGMVSHLALIALIPIHLILKLIKSRKTPVPDHCDTCEFNLRFYPDSIGAVWDKTDKCLHGIEFPKAIAKHL